MDAEQIVRALAAADEPVLPDEAYGAGNCFLCGAVDVFMGNPHEPTCPWRLAREWVADA